MIYIQTRGTNKDYLFLGGRPENSGWWLNYKDYTAFEQPTLVFESDSRGGRIYLSAIPSARKDKVGSVIRYTLVVQFSISENINSDRPVIRKLAKLWVNECDVLSRKLDEVFTKEVVDGVNFDGQINEYINSFVDNLKNVPECRLGDDISRKIDEMLGGQQGKLVFLNFLNDVDYQRFFKEDNFWFITSDRENIKHIKRESNGSASAVVPRQSIPEKVGVGGKEYSQKTGSSFDETTNGTIITVIKKKIDKGIEKIEKGIDKGIDKGIEKICKLIKKN